jgi:erythromycin esterase-like protein
MIAEDKIALHYHPLKTSRDLNPLLNRTVKTKYVLLGEASHGTHEYYTWRTAISKRLIEEQGFTFIAVEGDWPDCYAINRYVKGYTEPSVTAVEVLKTFKRWPTWMWANWEIVALMEWLRDFNQHRSADKKVGFYGLDVYSLWESMDTIVQYLKKEDPKSAQLAIDAYRCFEPYEEGHDYARAMLSLSANCSDEVIKLLQSVRKRSTHYNHDPEAALNAEMNAQVIANAEEYYRSMISFRDESWNIRDGHMAATLEGLMSFHGRQAKGIVWEHNTHIGDARYTDMRNDGVWNVGQLVREKHQNDGVYIVGFSSYAGTVVAGRSWGSPMEIMDMPPARDNTIEQILHDDAPEDKLLLLDSDYWKDRFQNYTGHRAIGVVYHPDRDAGNYVSTLLPSRYDALIHIDQTKALHPLHLEPYASQIPETYPFGF